MHKVKDKQQQQKQRNKYISYLKLRKQRACKWPVVWLQFLCLAIDQYTQCTIEPSQIEPTDIKQAQQKPKTNQKKTRPPHKFWVCASIYTL